MGNTEYSELCEISSKMQCPDCSLYWEFGISFSARAANACSRRKRNRQLNRARYDVLSTPGYVIERNPTHGARHGPPMRQCMPYKAHEMLKKARNNKNGYKNILDRWNNDDKYRRSLSDIGGIEERVMQYDEIALEDHSYIATRQDVGTSNHGNSHWTQKVFKDHWISAVTLQRRSRHAKDCTMSIQRSLEVETNLLIQSNKSNRSAIQQFEGLDEYDYRLEASTGWRHYPSSTAHSSSSSSSRWQPSSDLRSTWNWDSWESSSWCEQWICSLIVPEWVIFRLLEI